MDLVPLALKLWPWKLQRGGMRFAALHHGSGRGSPARSRGHLSRSHLRALQPRRTLHPRLLCQKLSLDLMELWSKMRQSSRADVQHCAGRRSFLPPSRDVGKKLCGSISDRGFRTARTSEEVYPFYAVVNHQCKYIRTLCIHKVEDTWN